MINSGARALKKKLSFERQKKEPVEPVAAAPATSDSAPTTPRDTGTPREQKGSKVGKLLRKISFNRDKKKSTAESVAEPPAMAETREPFKISLDANIPIANAEPTSAESVAPATTTASVAAPSTTAAEPVSPPPVAAPAPTSQADYGEPVPAAPSAANATEATEAAKAAEVAQAAEAAKAAEVAQAAEAAKAAKAAEVARAAEDADRISFELVKGAIEKALTMADEEDSKAATNDLSAVLSPGISAPPAASASPEGSELSRAPSTLAMTGGLSSAKGNPASPQAIETLHAAADKVPVSPLAGAPAAPPAQPAPADLCSALRCCLAQ